MTTPGAPVAFRLKRPYATEAEFVEGDGVGIFKSGMVLVGAGSRPEGVIVRFEVTLRDGTPLFRGEGKVVAHHPQPMGDIPAGLEIKFTRLDAHGKAVVDRALRLKAALATPQPIPDLAQQGQPDDLTMRLPSGVERVPSIVEPLPSPSDPHIVPAEILASVPHPDPTVVTPPVEPVPAAPSPEADASASDEAQPEPTRDVPSPEPTAIAPPVELVEAGVVASAPGGDPPALDRLRVRKIQVVERPHVRDELLGRLRARVRQPA